MKICLVNTYHYRRGGDSTYTFDLAELLRSRGHQVVHFAMKHPRNEKSEFEQYFVEHVDFLEIHETGRFFDKIRALGRSLYSREARRKFARLLDATHPDVIHLQNFRRHLTFSIVQEARRRDIPVIYTAHDYDPICPNSLLFSDGQICDVCAGKHYYRALFRRCKQGSIAGTLAIVLEGTFVRVMNLYRSIDMIVTPSEFLRTKLLQYGFDESRVVAIHNFIDADDYEPSYGGSGIIYYGRLAPEKGLIGLLQAASKVRDVHVMIAGDGPLKGTLKDLKERLGCRNVEMLGYVEHESLMDIIRTAAAVAMPSICYENFPYSILEAFALGKPVIASNIGGMPEIVHHGETGLLFEPGNWLALADHMLYLDRNPDKAEAMGKRARHLVERCFNADNHYRQLKQVYTIVRGGSSL